MKPKIVIILGATAVGKSELALELAARLDGEIINADSQQVYRHLDIGTGKPSKADRERVRHHLIDVVNPDEEFSAAMFRHLASEIIWQIHERQRPVIVCGGTGLYLKALTQGLFEGPGQDPRLRRQLENDIAEKGLASLHRRLGEVDAPAASAIHPNDRQRMIRALEVYRLTGIPLSEWQRRHGFQERRFETLKIGLKRERDEIYDLIERRSERMIEAGLLDELRAVVAKGYSLQLKPLRSVGYLQMGQVLAEGRALEDALMEMKQETRRLAKRQLTWFGADPEIRWFQPDQKGEIFSIVESFLSNEGAVCA